MSNAENVNEIMTASVIFSELVSQSQGKLAATRKNDWPLFFC